MRSRGAKVNSPAPRPSRNDPSNARAPASAAQVELHRRHRELVAVGEAWKLLDRKALAHVPVAVPVAGTVPVRRRSGADLEVHLAGVNLGGPGAVDVGRCLSAADSDVQQEQEEGNQVAHARLDGQERARWLSGLMANG